MMTRVPNDKGPKRQGGQQLNDSETTEMTEGDYWETQRREEKRSGAIACHFWSS